MALPSKEALALIGWLAHANEDALHTLARLRNLSANDLGSLTTLATALLNDASVGKALAQLPRHQLAALVAIDQGVVHPSTTDLEALSRWGLIDMSPPTPQLLFPRSHLSVLERLDMSASEPPTSVEDPLGSEATITSARLVQAMLAQLGDIVDALAKRAFPAAKTGILSANGLKALNETLGSGYDTPRLVALGRAAGLITLGPQGLQATRLGVAWRLHGGDKQWAEVATPWWAHLPEWITSVVPLYPGMNWQSDLALLVEYHYPLLPSSDGVAQALEEATLLGVLHQGVATPWGEHLWGAGPDIRIEHHFVEPVEGVYASEDFTLVASGPLRHEQRVLLDSLAHRELGGLVPRYRVTSRSIVRALQAGVRPTQVVPLLEQCALTPLPRSIVYVVEDTCRRAGEIELHPSRNGTRVVVATPALRNELLLDPSLTGLTLRELDDLTLVSPLPVERVNDFILGSRYLALIHHTHLPSSVPEALDVQPSPASTKVHTAVVNLVSSIQNAAHHGVSPSLGSVLEVAIASKVPLDITVEMPGGEMVSMVMEPRSVAGGRLRGVEVRNSMEKTIPVSSIRQAIPWSETGS